MYHAQNLFYWDDISNNSFNARWRDLTKATSNVAQLSGNDVTQICHSNSVYKCGLAAAPHENINLFAVNPAHAPWSQQLWEVALVNAQGDVHIATGFYDGFRLLGGSGDGLSGDEVENLIDTKPNIDQQFYTCGHALVGMLNECGAYYWLNEIVDH